MNSHLNAEQWVGVSFLAIFILFLVVYLWKNGSKEWDENQIWAKDYWKTYASTKKINKINIDDHEYTIITYKCGNIPCVESCKHSKNCKCTKG